VQALRLTEAVHQLLANSELPALLTIERCASQLAMSATSFRRKLSQEETSYKQIQAKFLNEFCVQALLAQQYNIDDLAIKLGYSERATFERAFRQKFGITPSKFRELAMLGQEKGARQQLISIAEQLPPIPDTCQQLLQKKDEDSLDTQLVVNIIRQDPIFSGRIIGLASKAIYGKTPKDLKEAVSRNLGVNTVVNFTVLFAVRDVLQNQIEPLLIERYSEAFMVAPKLLKTIRKSGVDVSGFDFPFTEQLVMFGLLGTFLLAHKSTFQHELMLHSLQGIEDLHSLNQQLKITHGMSIFSASALMLSLWHLDARIIKQLTHLERVSLHADKVNQEDKLVLFMMSCLYQMAARHTDYTQLAEQSELLGITNFDEIERLLHNV